MIDPLRQATCVISVATTRQGLLDVTPRIAEWVAAQHIEAGLLTVVCRHAGSI